MEQEIENQGYVVAGKMKGLAKLYLISWTVRSGQMSYENMVKVAKDNNLSKDQIPELRPAKNAFAVSKDVLKGMKLDTLLELEGWDGQVKQTLDVKPLKRGLEYQISIVREGMMNGKLHKDSIPVVRLKFSPPEDFNYRAWVKNYMRSFWDEKYIARIKEGKEEAPQISQMTQCITQLPYWDDTRVNPMLMMNIRNRIVQAFQTAVVAVDQEMLKAKFLRILKNDLNSVDYEAGMANMLVPAEVDGKDTSPTLDSLENLVASFAAGSSVEATERRYYDEEGEPRKQGRRRETVFRYFSFVPEGKVKEYLRTDFGKEISNGITGHQTKVINAIEAVDWEDPTSVSDFEENILPKLEANRSSLNTRISNIGNLVDGEIKIDAYTDVGRRFSSRIGAIPQTSGATAARLKRLATFDN